VDEPGRVPSALAVSHRRCVLLTQGERGLFVRGMFHVKQRSDGLFAAWKRPEWSASTEPGGERCPWRDR